MTGAPGPGWTTRGPSVAAGRLRVITSLAFAGSFAVGGSWAIAMPWDGGPDEQAHITRAAGWSGEASPRRPTTGRAVRLGGRGMAVQGRYILPTAVGAALLAASIADERGLPFACPAIGCLAAVTLPAHLAGPAYTIIRYQHGFRAKVPSLNPLIGSGNRPWARPHRWAWPSQA